MEGLWELTNALSNGTIPDPLRPPLPQDWGFAIWGLRTPNLGEEEAVINRVCV